MTTQKGFDIFQDFQSLPFACRKLKHFPTLQKNLNNVVLGNIGKNISDIRKFTGENNLNLKKSDMTKLSILVDNSKPYKRDIMSFMKIILIIFLVNCIMGNSQFGSVLNLTSHFNLKSLSKFYLTRFKRYDPTEEYCTIEAPNFFADLFRAPVNCKKCQNIHGIPKLANVTPDQFEREFAYSLQPVIIIDAQQNWTANEEFGLDFFKSIYKPGSPVLEKSEKNCQFFPYKTEFKNLKQVFSMSLERAQLKDGFKPWYVGWSNCDPEAANLLRKYYSKPYFLPEESESSRTDWIFIGSPGYGAHMHIDHVGKPSWQAQIKGYKKWFLQPPPECYLTCKNLEVLVGPGETIVLDTNKWYHQTKVVGDELSVVIGSEYD